METFCSYLWEGIYINRSGAVFACCHQKPIPYGNINNASLKDLINSPSALQLRLDSLKGQLSCYPSCNLLDKERSIPHGCESERIDYNTLKRIHISFGEACNIRCVMCNNPQNHKANPILLDSKVVIRNVDLTPFTTVMLRGGEPLVLRPCLEYIDYLEKIGKRYTILTNGLPIDDERAARLAENAHSVIVSLNGATKEVHESVNKGSHFETVVQNIQKMKRARDSFHSNLILVGHMTITTSNLHEVPLFLKMFRKFGFDRVNFGYVKETVPIYLANNQEFAKKLREKISDEMRPVDELDVDVLRLKLLGLWQGARTETSSSSKVLAKACTQATAEQSSEDSVAQRLFGDYVLNILNEIDDSHKVIALIRHSECEKAISASKVDTDNASLTKHGVDLARRLGRNLQTYNQISMSHSSIGRSIQTASEIHAGYSESHSNSKPTLEGRDPIFSIIYRGTVDKNLRELCRVDLRGQAFTQLWLDGQIPRNIMRPAKETIDRFLTDIKTRLRKAPSGSVHIHVGHDREIEVVRTALLGGRLGDLPTMDFLDGLVFYAQGEKPTQVRWRNRIVKLAVDSEEHSVCSPQSKPLGDTT